MNLQLTWGWFYYINYLKKTYSMDHAIYFSWRLRFKLSIHQHLVEDDYWDANTNIRFVYFSHNLKHLREKINVGYITTKNIKTFSCGKLKGQDRFGSKQLKLVELWCGLKRASPSYRLLTWATTYTPFS